MVNQTKIRVTVRAAVALLGVLSVGSCLHKPGQYDPTNDPAFFPDAQAGTRGSGGAGGSRGSDGPTPMSQVCGTTCDAEKSDGCCPVGCNGASDIDCASQCGNGVIEKGEQCDPPGSCPSACPNRGCTRFNLEGSAAECTAVCTGGGLETACKPDDGCCPAGCTVADDSDCSIMCGNGTREGNETCDPVSSCPTACLAMGCQQRKLVNQGSCTAECVNDRLQTTCVAGDGCCPPGCHNGNDADCQATCGNNIKEPGELCDGDCPSPSSCSTSGCSLRRIEGSGCNARCLEDTQTQCRSGDGCCPGSCNNTNDTDCKAICGNNVREAGELCDGNCPTSCPPQNCQNRRMENDGTCQARCVDTGPISCSGCTRCMNNSCENACRPDEHCEGNRCEPNCSPGASCTTNPNSRCFQGRTTCNASRPCEDDTTRPKCTGRTTCVNNSCKSLDGEDCDDDDDCANRNCQGQSFCNGGSNANCPCSDGNDCESQRCEQFNKTCGGRDCSVGVSSCGTNPPRIKTCRITCTSSQDPCKCDGNNFTGTCYNCDINSGDPECQF
jgi:hypothetical protein